MLWKGFLSAFCLATQTFAATQPADNDDRPVVELGYARYKATYNDTGDFYAFKNIRFANPPVGQHRFKQPQAVSTVDRTINDGSVGFACPQAFPEWYLKSRANATGITTDQLRDQLLKDPTMSEDCLFLNVLVPKSIYRHTSKSEQDKSSCSPKKGAPVMVWIYGGGYVFGHKDQAAFDPAGLLARSQEGNDEGIVFVALNYRLGLYGWLNGQGDKDVFPNVALQDQRLGLQWVKKNIHLFGGDSNRITVFGESAGGGSIMHQLTGNGGKTKVPFDRAIIQSPGWLPSLPVSQLWNDTLAAATKRSGRSIKNGADLASLDTQTLLQVNSDIVYKANYGDFAYGPTVDGSFVPAYPGTSLLRGHFDHSPQIMAGHNAHESDIFTSTEIDNLDKIKTKLRTSIYGIKDSALDYVLNVLYPDPSKTSLYTDQHGRISLIMSEYVFVCNTRWLATASGNCTWNYRFQVPPGSHAQDIPYTFHGSSDVTGVITALAKQMQSYFTRYASTGNPNKPSQLPNWPLYTKDANIVTFGTDGVGTATDDGKNARCDFWQQGTYA